MSFCFLYNVISENHSVQNSPWGWGVSIASSRSNKSIRHFVRIGRSKTLFYAPSVRLNIAALTKSGIPGLKYISKCHTRHG